MANDMMGNGRMGSGMMGNGMMGNGMMGNGMMGSSMMRNSMMAYAMKAMDQDMSVNDNPEVRKMKVELEKKKLQANMSLYDTMQPQQQQPPPQQPPGNSIGQNVISGNQGKLPSFRSRCFGTFNSIKKFNQKTLTMGTADL